MIGDAMPGDRSGYRGDGSYADALFLAHIAGVPVVGYESERDKAPVDWR